MYTVEGSGSSGDSDKGGEINDASQLTLMLLNEILFQIHVPVCPSNIAADGNNAFSTSSAWVYVQETLV